MQNKTYKAIIFDLDGTLLNTLEDLHAAVNKVLSENGEPVRSLKQIRDAVGNGNRMLMELSIEGGKNHPKFEELYRAYVKEYLANDTILTKPYEGVDKVLSYCKDNGIKTAIISNKVQSATRHLAAHYFSDTISVVMGDNEVRPRKPAPDVAYDCIKELGVDIKDVLYVGDAPVDAQFAKAAGMDCVLCAYGFNDLAVLKPEECLGIINSPLDLLEYI